MRTFPSTGTCLAALASAIAAAAFLAACGNSPRADGATVSASTSQLMQDKVIKTDVEWQQQLTAEQFEILRRKGTERAFTGQYWNNHEDGVYRCAGCAQELFAADTKYESGTGWPSFYQPIAPENVATVDDSSFFMRRTEVICSRCDGHLGHVFEDGPKPTGLRYCINSAALTFEKGSPARRDDSPKPGSN